MREASIPKYSDIARVWYNLRMPMQDNIEDLRLSTGNTCRLIRIRNALIPRYYLLAFPADQGEPTPHDIAEMINFGTTRYDAPRIKR